MHSSFSSEGCIFQRIVNIKRSYRGEKRYVFMENLTFESFLPNPVFSIWLVLYMTIHEYNTWSLSVINPSSHSSANPSHTQSFPYLLISVALFQTLLFSLYIFFKYTGWCARQYSKTIWLFQRFMKSACFCRDLLCFC